MKKNKIKLNPKQQLYLDEVLNGLSNKQIAEKYGVCVGTIKNTLTKVYAKIGTHPRVQTIEYKR